MRASLRMVDMYLSHKTQCRISEKLFDHTKIDIKLVKVYLDYIWIIHTDICINDISSHCGVQTLCGCIWVLFPAAGHKNSWQTVEKPPATHSPKSLVMVRTAVKQGWISQREQVRPYGEKKISGRHTRIWLVDSSVDHVS